MMTATMQHTWVKHTITPVEVMDGIEGAPAIFVDPDEQAMSEQTAAYGCGVCGVPLADNLHTNCSGEDLA